MAVPAVKPGEVREGCAGPAEDRPVAATEPKHTLGDMLNDGFCFFTTALITTHGLFDRDPLVEYRRNRPQLTDQDAPFAIDSQYPFFSGIGHGLLNGQFINWDHRLYGVHKSHFDDLLKFVAAIAMYDQQRYHYAKVGWHPLIITDPTALHSGRILTEIPRIPITVFCVSGNRTFAYIEPAKDPPRTLPFLKLRAPDRAIQVEAEALLGPPADPSEFAKFKESQYHGETDR